MMIVNHRIRCQTQGNTDVVDLTDRLAEEISTSGIHNGSVMIFAVGSTVGITTLEYEPALVADLQELLHRLVPEGAAYRHNRTDGEKNGHSHLRAAIFGPSLVVPIVAGRMLLGTWQQVVLIDFDVRPRTREVVIQVSGE